MVFGKIEYLNLLPFHIFMKRFLRFSRLRQSMHYHRGVPSTINEKFRKKRVDAAFISSIHASPRNKNSLGIIAKKEVKSVLVIPGTRFHNDSESETSNKLARILDTRGRILIGDKALLYSLENKEAIDLAALWHARFSLPFVFAVLQTNKKLPILQTLQKRFAKESATIKIPYYLLQKAAKRTRIPPKEILCYLRLISYKLDAKSTKSLRKFLAKAKQKEKQNKIIT